MLFARAMLRTTTLLLLALTAACGGHTSSGVGDPAPSATTPNPPPGPTSGGIVGDYGYDGPPSTYEAATIKATDTSAAFQFQCMRGETGPIVPDASGKFTLSGSLTTTGGAIHTISNVTFTGTVEGDTMTFGASWPSTMTTSNGTQPYTETYGPITLTKGLVPERQPGCI